MNSQALAARNGHNIESQICNFLGIPHDYNGIVDAHLNDRPLEIKSCQMIITDKSHSNQTRQGRFVFNEEQHRHLVRNNGIYALIVHDDAQIKHTCLKRASLISGIVGRACGRTWKGVIS